jgi:uncharacterized protein YyaL (SSP411 family)
MPRNHLANATSPYLLQHADNPVDWYPWGREALNLARESGKPILLSIGYSACHWCHVMAHESFEEPETAALMNDLFINIKVDREERPDLDRIYQSAHQLLAQRPGGWPLTLFLTPDDQTPFFAGTYFPPEPRHGLPAFRDLLQQVTNAWQGQQQEIRDQNRSLLTTLSRLNPAPLDDDRMLDSAPLETARQQLARSFDETHGGFGPAPRFPHPASLNRLLRHWAATAIGGQPDPRALHLVEFTLRRMALGGINDQLGGGFCRYSVDDQWMIPHFEKMLYDNGPLLVLYSDLWQITGKTLFRETLAATAGWVMREMQAPTGGYYSSLDADSEGAEGSFYLWTREQIRALLEEEEYRHLARYYGLDRSPNFEGRWHLHNRASVAELNQAFDSSAEQARALLSSARRKLFRARECRPRPGRDEKILTSWNALMIKGMTRAGRLLGDQRFIDSAGRSLEFIRQALWRDGRLLATHKDGHSHLAGYLDDYAYLIDALLERLQTRWQRPDLEFARELADVLLGHFQDPEAGGFFFTADDHERLIQRPKPLGDDSTPAGNGVAAFALARLGHLLGEQRYLGAAEGAIRTAWEHIRQIPHAHCTLLEALEEQIQPTETIVIRGTGAALEQWRRRALQHYAPRRFTLAIPSSETQLPGLLGAREPGGETRAYICSGTRCEAPIEDFTLFDQRLAETEVPPAAAVAPPFEGGSGSYKRVRE